MPKMLQGTVSHYRILEKIGEGGMGEVYLAEDLKLRRKVALKFLSTELTRDEDRRQRFIQEARAAAAVEHPHIAAVHDVDEAEGRTFIAMEYVRGESLRAAIRKGNLTAEQALHLAVEVAEGLAKAHEHGIVHRDLKPENILVSDEGYAKIIDFGLAKLVEPLPQDARAGETDTMLRTREGQVMGTIAYMSPEQARGVPVDARTDVFSLGAVIYEMLNGQSPFRRESFAETLSAVLKENPPPLAGGVWGVVSRALAKDPERRYASMREMAAELKKIAEEKRGVRRSWMVAAGLMLLVGAGAAYVAIREQRPRGVGASGRPTIAVMVFEDHTGSEEIRWLSQGLPEMLLTDLAQTPGLDVVSGQRLSEALRQIGKDNLAALDQSLMADVARRAGAGAVVMGSIFKSGAEIRIDVRVEDVDSGRILSAQSVRGSEVFPLVDELTGRIRNGLRVETDSAARGIGEITSSSLEAFQQYSEGMEALRNLRYADARRLFEKAVEIDPAFAMAHFEVWHMSQFRGDRLQSRQHLDQVLQHLQRLPERHRLRVEAGRAEMEGKTDRAMAALEQLIARYPDESDAYARLATLFGRDLGQPEKAAATLKQGIQAVPGSGALHNSYGYYLLWSGRYPEALREFEAYERLNPREPNPYDSQAEAYLVIGQPEKAIEKYNRVLEVDPTFYAPYSGRAWAHAMLGRYDQALAEVARLDATFSEGKLPRTDAVFLSAFMLSRVGRLAEAGKRIEEGVGLSTAMDDTIHEAAFHALAALMALERGDLRETVEGVRREQKAASRISLSRLRRIQGELGRLLEGTAQARSAKLDAARALASEGARQYDPKDSSESWLQQALEGEIALAAGDLAAAEAAFSAGEPPLKAWFNNGVVVASIFGNCLPFRDGLARVAAARGDLATAIAQYRRLLTPELGSKWTAMLEPRYALELARLLEKTGDREGARVNYQRFLDLWKNADPGLAELKEAKERLARLR